LTVSIYHSFYPTGERQALFNITGYNHEVLLIGGFRNANFSFYSSNPVAEEWFYTGVGRHVEVYNRRGNKIWEGAVNEVSFNVGPRSVKVGPLFNVSNRINIGWQHPNYGIPGDPLAGVYEETGWKDNEDSQTRYGVLEELISGGTGEEPEMLTFRDDSLEKKAEPGLSETLSSGSDSSSISMSVSCIGYTRMLEKQVYNLPWQSGFVQVDLAEKVNEILDANLYFDVDREEEKNRTAWGIINDHINKSSLSGGIKCGIFSEMQFSLEKIDADIRYWRRAGSARVLDEYGNPVENSEVLPGGHMAMADFSTLTSYRINSVRYDLSGDTVSLNYQDGSLRSVLSNMMLGGLA
jgi:hypothetical protein